MFLIWFRGEIRSLSVTENKVIENSVHLFYKNVDVVIGYFAKLFYNNSIIIFFDLFAS